MNASGAGALTDRQAGMACKRTGPRATAWQHHTRVREHSCDRLQVCESLSRCLPPATQRTRALAARLRGRWYSPDAFLPGPCAHTTCCAGGRAARSRRGLCGRPCAAPPQRGLTVAHLRARRTRAPSRCSPWLHRRVSDARRTHRPAWTRRAGGAAPLGQRRRHGRRGRRAERHACG